MEVPVRVSPMHVIWGTPKEQTLSIVRQVFDPREAE